MSAESTGIPEPFPDVVADRRTEEQRARDVAGAMQQVGFFTSAEPRIPPENLIPQLQERRAGSVDAVQFEQAPPTTDGIQPLVVRGEVLLRRGEGNLDEGQATELLQAGSFRLEEVVPREQLRSEPAPPDEMQSDWEFPELESRLLRFVAPPGPPSEIGAVIDTVQRLRGLGFSVGHVGVAAFQGGLHPESGGHHPGGDVVVKLAEGPAPTTVSDPSAPAGEGTSNVLVGVIDTGIGKLLHGDGWLATVPRVERGVDPLDAFPVQRFPTMNGNGYLDFAAGHGTFVSAVVQSVEPQATIRCYRALDSDGYGSEIGVACAMLQAARDGCQVINLSLGVRTVDGKPPLAIQAALEAIAQLSAGGEPPVIVAAAGNFGDTARVFPAASDGVIAVGALDAEGRPAGWSSRGDWVDVSTVGEGVVAPYVVGIREPDFGGAVFPFPGWAMWTGTSFAAPQITGAIARIARTDGISARDAATRLLGLAAPDPEFGVSVRLLPGTRTARP